MGDKITGLRDSRDDPTIGLGLIPLALLVNQGSAPSRIPTKA